MLSPFLRLYTCPHASIFLRNKTFYNINRLLHDSIESEGNHCKIIKSARLKQLSSTLLRKILENKNEKTRQQMIRIYIKMNRESRFREIPVDYLLQSKMSNRNEAQGNVINQKYSESLSKPFSVKPTKLGEDCGLNSSSSDTKSVPRPKRGDPGEVIWGFIPKEWSTFFVPITGHSGFYTLLFTSGTYLFSKEIYVCDHEYYNGISIAILWIYMVKKHGLTLARYLDKEIEKYEIELNNNKEIMKQHFRDSIHIAIKEQESIEGQLTVIEAKRENVHLQREAEFRRRQMEVYDHVTRILDYQAGVAAVRKIIQHKNLIQWVTKEVEKSLTPELKENYVKLCIQDIQRMLKEGNKKKGNK